MEAGVRPINNIVDVTNYVMLELGQPLHAFDLDKIKGKKIIVRRAKDGEKIVTLDSIERNLNPNNLVIADEKEPIGIAGVMGGFDSEITEETTRVILESANFDSKSVRLTAKEHNLRTEASSRFEKGIDPNLCEIAAERACQLIEEIGGGKIVKGVIDVYENKRDEEIINLRPNKVNELLGTDLTVEQMVDYLERLGLTSSVDENRLEVKVPTFRLDLSIEADLIEEIGRIHGFHNISVKPLVGVLTRGEKPYEKIVEDRAKSVLQGLGLNEVMTYSFISPKAYDRINIEKNSPLRNYIELINPLGEDYSVMRTTLIPNILDLLTRNYNRGIKDCYVYEIGNIFIPKELPLKDLPTEKKILAIGMYGNVDFYDIKEVVEILFDRMGIKGLEYVPEKKDPTFHPNRTANILYNGKNMGILGEIHIDVMEKYDIDTRIYIAHLDFDEIIKETKMEKKYKPLPKYPAIMRDIALVVDNEVLVGDIENIIWKHGEGLIEEVELFDVYTGDQIEEGKKSVAFSITYRSHSKTLEDEEVNAVQENIIKDLENQLGAKLRS